MVHTIYNHTTLLVQIQQKTYILSSTKTLDMNSMMSSSSSSQDDDSSSKDVVVDGMDDHQCPLPGFRFHPTDEELVSFYLKRKIDNRPLSIEIIKQMDIYKHDPWDLAKSSSVGDKEWYFYCKRGRKYRNSVRPNRVTGSGFWKATGIDKPIYSNDGEGQQCVGLKKSLVYYRGSAGKGTKTDWMMHEFRLPSDLLISEANSSNPNNSAVEAEIWTLCRIFKRNKRQTPDWKEISARRNAINSSSKSSNVDPNPNHQRYISFATYPSTPNNGYATTISTKANHNNNYNNNVAILDQKNGHFEAEQPQWNTTAHSTPVASDSSTLKIGEDYDSDLGYFFERNWDDLSSVVELAVRTPLL